LKNDRPDRQLTAAIAIYAVSTPGKSPEPYPHAALFKSVDRKLIHKNPPQCKNLNTSQNLPLQSPYTRVYGRREIFDTSHGISKLKLRSTHTSLGRPKMSGQGGSRGAARALTTDPDFEMRDVNLTATRHKNEWSQQVNLGREEKQGST
jgi:hypothetical protein